MINYRVGDLIEAAEKGHVHIIAHCCNCFNTMGSGIAPQIKKAFPYAWEADNETEKGDPAKLGTCSFGIAEPEDWEYKDCPDVFNLYGQYSFSGRDKGGRDLDYDALYDALVCMSNKLIEWGTEDLIIGLPLIGCGLAGGSWRVVSAMIEDTLGKTNLEIMVYVLNKEDLENVKI